MGDAEAQPAEAPASWIEQLKGRIDAEYTKEASKEKPRQYIGASGIGTKCQAELALSLRGFPSTPPDGQLARIFRDGHDVEEKVIDDLVSACLPVTREDPATKKQWNFSAYGGHVRANLDGIIDSNGYLTSPMGRAVLEVKSMNRAMFEKLKKRGVAVSHPEYMDQMQLQMGLSGIGVALLAAYCKDNSQYHFEEVPFDKEHYQRLLAKAADAMFKPAQRMHPHKNAWDCKQCFKRGACWEGAMPETTSCAQCKHAVPLVSDKDRAWHCGLHGYEATAVCGDFNKWRPARTIPIKTEGNKVEQRPIDTEDEVGFPF